MRLTKYTFRTPLFGSIECEGLLPDTDERIELIPEEMCRMYDKNEKLLLFLTENMEELSAVVPEELKYTVLRAEFGDCAMIGGKMYLRTYIWVEGNLTEQGTILVQEWITGQMSDGWGESLEQKEWMTERVEKPVITFNAHTLEFEEDVELHHVSYYVNPWNSDEFDICLEDCEVVEEDAEFKIVGTIALPHYNRQVIKIRNGFALRVFLRDFGQMDLSKNIEDSCPKPDGFLYLVRDLDETSGVEILPRWAVEPGFMCAVYHMSEEGTTKEEHMHISRAVLELLK